jgi:hypothetical protein
VIGVSTVVRPEVRLHRRSCCAVTVERWSGAIGQGADGFTSTWSWHARPTSPWQARRRSTQVPHGRLDNKSSVLIGLEPSALNSQSGDSSRAGLKEYDNP